MLPKIVLLVALLPLVMPWPSDMFGDDKKTMMEMFMKMHEKKEEYGKDKMMEYMKAMMEKKEQEHYPGDADGCTGEDKMKSYWKKMEEKEKMKKLMMEMYEFKKYVEEKKTMEEKYAEEQKEKMMEMYKKHKEMKEKMEKEKEFQDMIDSFQETKHKFAFKLVHEMLKLCQCGEVSEQMSKMMGPTTMDKMNMTKDMMDDDTQKAMDTGDMEALAKKFAKMSPEEKKKMFMAGMIKSMCQGAKTYVAHVKQFEEQYMLNNNETMIANTTSTP